MYPTKPWPNSPHRNTARLNLSTAPVLPCRARMYLSHPPPAPAPTSTHWISSWCRSLHLCHRQRWMNYWLNQPRRPSQPFARWQAQEAAVRKEAEDGNQTSLCDIRFENTARQSPNGSCIKIVSSRSGLVDSKITGASIISSIRLTYLMARAGRSAHERAPRVVSSQPAQTS